MKLRVESIGISLEGFIAGPDQSLDDPLGVGGHALHEWQFSTQAFHSIQGGSGGASGVDNDVVAHGFENIGAWIIGRNMFGPIRGDWPNDAWKGWWGTNPPFHTPVFVLTHYPRAPIAMEGGTTFYFVTDGAHSALQKAFEASNGLDVRLGGGASTIAQYLRAKLVDEMHLAMVPALLGSGEPLLSGLDLPSLGYRCVKHVASPNALHVTIERG